MKKEKIVLLLIIILFALNTWIYYSNHLGHINSVAAIDEYFSIYLMHGMAVGGRTQQEDSLYKTMPIQNFVKINTLKNIYNNTIRDGGNGLLYYMIGHYLCSGLAKHIGILHTLRFFNVILSFTTLLLIFYFGKKFFNLLSAFGACCLYIFVSYEYGLFIRTYMLSTLLTFILFYLAIQPERNLLKNFLLFGVGLLMLFSHFFCIFPIIAVILWEIYMFFKYKTFFANLARRVFPLIIAIGVFTAWYLSENQEGRNWQTKVSKWRQEKATQWGTNNGIGWIIPTQPNLLLSENIEWWLYYTNLDLRQINNHIRLLFLGIFLALFLISATWLARRKIFDNNAALLLVIIVLFHWLALNILAILSGHLTSIEYKFYGFIVFPMIASLIGVLFSTSFSKKILLIFYFLMIVNYFYGSYRQVHRNFSATFHSSTADWQADNNKMVQKIQSSYEYQ
ncbi:MAG: hypothetical protein RMJ97_05965 [Raineya sp.]|nr:hypothetical protein [Raineya sp.]